MTDVYLLDAGALLTNWVDKHPKERFMTTKSVVDELRNRPSRQRIEFLLSTNRIEIGTPTPSFLEKARALAKRSGDEKVLSDTDIELLALALEQSSDSSITLVSTDLAVLNVGAHTGLIVMDPAGRMRHVIIWGNKCPACGHVESGEVLNNECPICGTQMRRVRVKSNKR